MEGKVKTIIAVIVLVIMTLTIIGSLASTVDTASESVTQDARCASAGCFWNATGTPTQCQAVTSLPAGCGTVVARGAFPLESLFNTGGIVILMFIAAGLIMVIGIVMKVTKKR